MVNPDAAINLAEGGVVDGIGHAMYSALTFKDGTPEQSNFDKYRLIRHSEAPKEIEVHFVDNQIDPTGLGEPPFPQSWEQWQMQFIKQLVYVDTINLLLQTNH